MLLEQDRKMRQQLIDTGLLEGGLAATRASLRRVLARRQLTLSEDEGSRIEACTGLVTLERWIDRAVTAVRASDALGRWQRWAQGPP